MQLSLLICWALFNFLIITYYTCTAYAPSVNFIFFFKFYSLLFSYKILIIPYLCLSINFFYIQKCTYNIFVNVYVFMHWVVVTVYFALTVVPEAPNLLTKYTHFVDNDTFSAAHLFIFTYFSQLILFFSLLVFYNFFFIKSHQSSENFMFFYILQLMAFTTVVYALFWNLFNSYGMSVWYWDSVESILLFFSIYLLIWVHYALFVSNRLFSLLLIAIFLFKNYYASSHKNTFFTFNSQTTVNVYSFLLQNSGSINFLAILFLLLVCLYTTFKPRDVHSAHIQFYNMTLLYVVIMFVNPALYILSIAFIFISKKHLDLALFHCAAGGVIALCAFEQSSSQFMNFYTPNASMLYSHYAEITTLSVIAICYYFVNISYFNFFLFTIIFIFFFKFFLYLWNYSFTIKFFHNDYSVTAFLFRQNKKNSSE
jgi:hypothetical protein